MKKILFAAFMISLMGVTFAQNSHLVYNYQASIRRLNANYFIGVANGSQTVAERYSVVSDTIQGYLVVPVCYACNIEGVNVFRETGDVDIYLTRVGDTLNRQLNRPFVFKTKAGFDAGVFGAYVALNTDPASNAPLQSTANINQAWMRLNINPLPDAMDILPVPSKSVLPNVAENPKGLIYGFYGLDNVLGNVLENAGFGTVMSTRQITASTYGWCGTTPGSESNCQIIQSITGSTIGNPTYQGACNVTPMWDLCYRVAPANATTVPLTNNTPVDPGSNIASVNQGAVCGTWILVYDAALSNVADANKEAAILTRMGATASKMLDLTYPTAKAKKVWGYAGE